ncbi:uncharacterized protein DUF4190 [Cellulosimicrobium cellulans J34]|nr:uncharacterized protein DUF4190 [Cellulosimicrobium cellulans J34]SME89381.1 Pyruvate-formate lyase [Cellulosimicrobium cellulans J1]
MTTPPVPPYGSPDEPVDPYAPVRPQQPPLTPYNPPTDAAPTPDQGGFVAPSGAGGGYGSAPSGPGTGAPYGTPDGAGAPGSPGSPYGPGAAPPYGSAPGAGYGTPQGYGAPGYPPQPAYGAYPPAYGAPYTPPPRNNGLALASMIVSIASLVLCAGFPAIVGLVLGIVALNQVMRDGTRGRGFAVAGIVVGAVGTAFAMLVVVGATLSEP